MAKKTEQGSSMDTADVVRYVIIPPEATILQINAIMGAAIEASSGRIAATVLVAPSRGEEFIEVVRVLGREWDKSRIDNKPS